MTNRKYTDYFKNILQTEKPVDCQDLKCLLMVYEGVKTGCLIEFFDDSVMTPTMFVKYIALLQEENNAIDYVWIDKTNMIVWNINLISFHDSVKLFNDRQEHGINFNDEFKNNESKNIMANILGYYTKDYYLSIEHEKDMKNNTNRSLGIFDSHKFCIYNEIINPIYLWDTIDFYASQCIKINSAMAKYGEVFSFNNCRT